MYMILWWVNDDDYLTHVANRDSSIKLFNTIKEADEHANKCHFHSDNMRVISIEGVKI